MIESVEGFETEFERLGFREFGHFVQSDIEIVNTRPVEEASLDVSLRP